MVVWKDRVDQDRVACCDLPHLLACDAWLGPFQQV